MSTIARLAGLALLLLAIGSPARADTAGKPPQPTGTAGESAETHASTGIQARAAAPSQAAVPARVGQRETALARIESHLACACYEGGAWNVDAGKPLTASACPCAEAKVIRADLEQALASLTTAQLADKQKVAEQLEIAFVPLRAEYERVFRYPRADYEWFMNNVRCVCEGCKPTIFFSKCQLSCTPGIVYKLRAKIFLALGFTKDELLDYYRDEYNAAHSAREQITRDWLLPGRQREQGWLVPALVFAGAAVLLIGLLRRWVRAGRAAGRPIPVTGAPTDVPDATQGLSREARARVRRAMDSDDDAG